jgi:hypothetical protein
LNHTIQAERALMQPFMLGCGPWRPFFRDHESGVPRESHAPASGPESAE